MKSMILGLVAILMSGAVTTSARADDLNPVQQRVLRTFMEFTRSRSPWRTYDENREYFDPYSETNQAEAFEVLAFSTRASSYEALRMGSSIRTKLQLRSLKLLLERAIYHGRAVDYAKVVVNDYQFELINAHGRHGGTFLDRVGYERLAMIDSSAKFAAMMAIGKNWINDEAHDALIEMAARVENDDQRDLVMSWVRTESNVTDEHRARFKAMGSLETICGEVFSLKALR